MGFGRHPITASLFEPAPPRGCSPPGCDPTAEAKRCGYLWPLYVEADTALSTLNDAGPYFSAPQQACLSSSWINLLQSRKRRLYAAQRRRMPLKRRDGELGCWILP